MLTIWMSYWYWCVASPRCSELESLMESIMIIILALSAALSLSQRVTNSLTGRTSTFGSGSNREDKVETPVNSGPDPCLPEICDKMSVRQTHSLALFLFFLMQMLFMSGWHLDPWEMVFVPFSHPWHRRQSFLWVDGSTSHIRLQVRLHTLSISAQLRFSLRPWLTDWLYQSGLNAHIMLISVCLFVLKTSTCKTTRS